MIPGVTPEQARVSQGEKFGIAITAAFLLIAVTAIFIFQLMAPRGKSDSKASAESNVLEGGVIAEPGSHAELMRANMEAGRPFFSMAHAHFAHPTQRFGRDEEAREIDEAVTRSRVEISGMVSC